MRRHVMRKYLALAVVVTLAFTAFVQESVPGEIRYNHYLKKADELKLLADQSFEAGDYDGSADYAAQAQEYVSLSDKFVETMLKKDAADKAIALAGSRIEWAQSLKAETFYPDAWKTANQEMEGAQASYAAEDYDSAKLRADAVLAALVMVSDKPALPAIYMVRLMPERRDCFWNISGYSFIYNDPTKWEKLYLANKSRLVNPQNPNLIHPGLKLVIPPLRGEVRNGTFDPSKKYESLDSIVPKTKK